MITEDEIKMANKTSRHGGFAKNAVTPKYISEIAQITDRILDYGAGKDAVHTKMLQETHHLNVIAYDFGANINENHTPDALNNEYSIVFASNVINVQTSKDMLNTTLTEMFNASNDVVVFNYPKIPRKLDMSIDDIILYVRAYFTDNVHLVEKSTIIHCIKGTHWTDRHITYDTEKEMYIGWDEAGLYHCEYEEEEDVRNSLIHYSVNVLNKNG